MVDILMLFTLATQTYGLPNGLLRALCYVESAHNVKAVRPYDGQGESLGICQIKLNTAKLLGFNGTREQLLEPKNNIFYAGAYLQKQLTRYDGNLVKAVAAYNAGKFLPNKNNVPVNLNYVKKVFRSWESKK